MLKPPFLLLSPFSEKEIKKRVDENNELKALLNRNANQSMVRVDEMIQALESFKQEQNENRIKMEFTINDKIRNSDDNLINLETTQKDLICYFDTASSNMIKEDKENLANYDLLDQLVCNTLPYEVCDFQSTVRELRKNSDEQLKALRTVHESDCEQLASLTAEEMKLLSETHELCEENGRLIKSSIKQKNEQFVRIRDNLSAHGERIERTESEVGQQLKNAVSFNVELLDTYKSEINLKENHLAGLKRDLVKCDPTGNTPQKSAFDFPKEIKPVTPYQKILKRFLLKPADSEDTENLKPDSPLSTA